MLKNMNEQFKAHKSEETSGTFFDTTIFCTNVTYADGSFKRGSSFFPFLSPAASSLTVSPGVDLVSGSIETVDADMDPVKLQRSLAAIWLSLIPEFPRDNVHILPSIEHAIRVVRGIESEGEGEGVDVLVTGSLHLVGGVIEVAGLSDAALWNM